VYEILVTRKQLAYSNKEVIYKGFVAYSLHWFSTNIGKAVRLHKTMLIQIM